MKCKWCKRGWYRYWYRAMWLHGSDGEEWRCANQGDDDDVREQ